MSSSKKVNIFELRLPGKLETFGKHLLPQQRTNAQLDWVIFGDKPEWVNQQPQYYDYLSKLSSKNGAILKAKDRYVWGKGFKVQTSNLDRAQEIEVIGFFNTLKGSRLFKRIISDRNKYGGFAVEMIPNKKGTKALPHYLPFKNIRVGKKEYSKVKGEEKDLLPTIYYFTSDWSTTKGKILQAPDFQVFDKWDWDADSINKSKRYIVYFKDEGFEDDAYPLPDYQGGVPYIDADTEVGNFVFNNVKNGFTSGLLVQFFGGDPGDDQKRELEKMWHNYLHGSENAGKAMMAWLNNQDEKIEVTPLSPNGQDNRYIELNKQIGVETFVAHTISPLVVGMTGESGFSNNADEKRVAIEAFNEDFVASTQEIFNDFANELLSFNDIKGTVELQRLDSIRAQLTESVLTQILDRNELREIAGYAPVENVEIVQNSREIIIKMSKQDEDKYLIEQFTKLGTLDKDLEIIAKRDLFVKDFEDAEIQGLQFVHENFATIVENTILRLLLANPLFTASLLSSLLGISLARVETLIAKMKLEGLLDEDGIPIEEPDDEIFTVYKYEKRSDVSGGDIISTTRDFCRNLVVQSRFKSWTIEDIRLLNNGVPGLDVFRSRGGWYTLPGTDNHVPFCRHIWKALLVRRRPQ